MPWVNARQGGVIHIPKRHVREDWTVELPLRSAKPRCNLPRSTRHEISTMLADGRQTRRFRERKCFY
jgi:hypothetical protein